MTDGPLRIVSLNAFLPGYLLVADWALRHGHELILVVTPPITAGQRYDESALPIGRGPNPARLIYEGDDKVAATVHRTEAEFDTGAIPAQRTGPLPEDLNGPALLQAWRDLPSECLDFAVPRVVAGEPGRRQNPAEATEAPFFTPEEHRLKLTEPADVIRRKVAAVNVTSPQARIQVDGVEEVVALTYAVPADEADAGNAEPGAVLRSRDDGWIVQTGDSGWSVRRPGISRYRRGAPVC